MTATSLPDLIARLRVIAKSLSYEYAADSAKILESITHLERLALLEAAVTDEEVKALACEIAVSVDVGLSGQTKRLDQAERAVALAKRLSLQVKEGREALLFAEGFLKRAEWSEEGAAQYQRTVDAIISQNPGQPT